MPKASSSRPSGRSGTTASSSESARKKPLQPIFGTVRKTTKWETKPSPAAINFNIDDDGLELVDKPSVIKPLVISLLSQPSTSESHEEPVEFISSATVTVEKVITDLADGAGSTSGLMKTSSCSSEGSQKYYMNSGFNDADLSAIDENASVAPSVTPSLCSSSTPSSESPSLSSGSTSSLGKRKSEYEGPAKIKHARPIKVINEPKSAPGSPKKQSYSKPIDDPCNPLGFSTSMTTSLDEPVVIASDVSFQKIAEAMDTPYGVLLEICRAVSARKLKFEEIDIKRLDKFSGRSNAEVAPSALDVLTGTNGDAEPEPTQLGAAVEDEKAAKSPWAEMDREQQEREKDKFAGLGERDDTSWYGGKVQYVAKLKVENGKPRIVLEKPVLGPSSRFPRRFGSHSFIRVSVKKSQIKISPDALLDFFRRPFILMCRVYRACYAKENTVFLFLTNERMFDVRAPPQANLKARYYDGELSLEEFLNWHNRLHLNSAQAMAKWAARFALGFSNSVPGYKLDIGQIFEIDDVASPLWSRDGKLPAELDMTDGSGYANCALLQLIRINLGLEEYPSVIQMRHGGAKGTLALRNGDRFNDFEKEAKVWLRRSQIKIKYDKTEPLDPAMLIVDVIRPSHMQTPSRLSSETLINLHENGVPLTTFIELMRSGMEDISNALTTWDGPDAMYSLFANVAKLGGVINARMARALGGARRAHGLGDEVDDDYDEDDGDENEGYDIETLLSESSAAWYADLISGQPSSLEETVMGLLSAGFRPDSNPVLGEKLSKVHETLLANFVSRFKLTVPMSCSAMIIPDPCDPPVLKEGQVHIKIDKTCGRFAGCASEDIIRGSVIVTRHPCKIGSDAQKMEAVEVPELRYVTNVIVFPKVGNRSPASLLGGGDYDGDTVIAVWDPEIVKAFKAPSNKLADTPVEVAACFNEEKETVEDLLRRTEHAEHGKRTTELQAYLLGSLKDEFLVGIYSNMHLVSVYENGYSHKDTIFLAHMFSTVMDGSKTGLIIKPEVFSKHQRRWGGRNLPWKPKKGDKPDTSNAPSLKRNSKQPFILEALRNEGKLIESELKDRFRDKRANAFRMIPCLAAPYLEYREKAQKVKEKFGLSLLLDELKCIEDHVGVLWEKHRQELNVKGSPSKRAGFSELHITDRQDVLRKFSRAFVLYPLSKDLVMSEVELRRVRASYAYVHDCEKMRFKSPNWTRFPWNVAYRELCAINASSLKFETTITRNFYERMNVVNKFRTIRK